MFDPTRQCSLSLSIIGLLGCGDGATGSSAAIYLWGDEWVQYDMVWSGDPRIEKFWSNAIKWVGPTTFCILPQ